MIFLVGTHHERQHNGIGSTTSNSTQNFVSYIKKVAKERKADFIGEEFNNEALKKSRATEATLKIIAQELKINHCFCDPNTKERQNLGIPSNQELQKKLNLPKPLTVEDSKNNERILEEEKKKYYKIREKFWLKKIQESAPKNMIFVCGIDHIKSFAYLLRQNSIEVLISDEKF